MCSNVAGVGPHAGGVQPRLVGEGVAPDVGLVGVGRAVEQLVDEVRASRSAGRAARRRRPARPSLSWRSAMIETRLALPVRSPTPLIVPWTCVAPASTASSVLATPQPASSWQWIPSATPGSAAGHDCGHRLARPGEGSEAPLVSHRTTPLGAAPRRPRAGTRARSRGRRASRRRSARRRASRACPRPTRKATDSAIIARFSSRETRRTFSTCSVHVLPTSVHTGAKHSASTRSPSSAAAATSAPARHPEGDDLGVAERLAREQGEELGLLGVRGGEARLDQVDAELVEPVDEADLLLGGQRRCPPRPCRRAAWRRRARRAGRTSLQRLRGAEATGTTSSQSR